MAALIVVPTFLHGLREPNYLILIAMTAITLGVNLAVSIRLMRRGWVYGAGYLGHAGVAVMVLGMGLSTGLGKSQRLELPHGRTVQALGYGLTYEGDQEMARGGRTLRIRVDGKRWRMNARPALLPSPQNEGVVRKPAIDGLRELYLSPLEVREGPGGEGHATWMERGREVELGGVRYTFLGFRMESQPEFRVVADLRVKRASGTLDVAPAMAAGPTGGRAIPLDVPGLGAITLQHIDADGGRAALILPGTVLAAGTAIVELSTKPFINLVWIGALLVLAGTSLAALRRAAETAPRPTGHAKPAL
jgi:cytochrome c biogenesis factor